ncbi:MAG: argininosuccinate lyase [Spirochaetales bacterium]|nr:MAG: argininosuccinate lyase [Spirochaetales bacterium]
MGKLWEKDYKADGLIERYTVGRDYLLDNRLVPWDCAGSMAHARMLASIGILTEGEASGLERELAAIIRDHREGRFIVRAEDEDCHTAIEMRLTEKLGEPGKKIHTGRSRNDQVLTALRLWGKSSLLSCIKGTLSVSRSFADFALRHEFVPMPGRTHMQSAMPSSVGLWSASYAEELLDTAGLLWAALDFTDQCPLGAAASYGVPLPLDREMTAELLGFRKVQRNVLYANNARGKTESVILDALSQIMLTLSKCSQDLILFSLPEFGYFSLPDRLCTGSSIMPQKKNPDALELLRAKTATMTAYALQVKEIIRALPGGYNRDFQETKEPFINGLLLARDSLDILLLTMEEVKVNPEKMAAGFTPDIYATDAALEQVSRGVPFREAYKNVGLNLKDLESRDPAALLKKRTSTGTPGNLGLPGLARETAELEAAVTDRAEAFDGAMEKLTGFRL